MKTPSCSERCISVHRWGKKRIAPLLTNMVKKICDYVGTVNLFLLNSFSSSVDLLLTEDDRKKQRGLLRGFRVQPIFERDRRGQINCRYQSYDLIFCPNLKKWTEKEHSSEYKNLRMQYIGAEEDLAIVYRQNHR